MLMVWRTVKVRYDKFSSTAMNMSKKLVLFSALITLCFARIDINSTESGKSSLVEAVVQILELCYGNRTTAVGLAGSSAGLISRALWPRKITSITLIDSTARIVSKNPVNLQYKLQVLAITATSSINLKKTFVEIKATIWWNHMADFLILDVDDGCTNVFKILWTAWEMNVLNAKCLCYHRTKGRLIYTFNPYTSQAPPSWQFEKTYKGKNNHPWTLFVRVYEDGERVCNELDYDKTVHLGGYEIRVAVVDAAFSDDQTNSDRICFSLFDDIMCKVIVHALNATPKVKVHHSLNSIGYVDDKGNFNGMLEEIFQGLSDIGVTERFLTSLGNLPHAYPHYLHGFHSLTQYSGYKSQLSKIFSVIDRRSRFSLCLVCLITILFFKYFLRQSVTKAHLSTLRIICNSSLPAMSGKVAARFYLGSLFLFALTVQGIYQGKLASLLTMREHLRNVDTMNDLVELGHTIYGLRRYRRYFTDSEINERFVEVGLITCAEYVLHNHKAACVGEETVLVFEAAKYNLHMSSEPFVNIWAALPIRPDWPLEHRLSKVLMTAVEAQGLRYSINDAMYKTYRLLQIQENRDKDQGAHVLTLDQLDFTFAILGIGLGCATISFIIEVSLERNRFRHLN